MVGRFALLLDSGNFRVLVGFKEKRPQSDAASAAGVRRGVEFLFRVRDSHLTNSSCENPRFSLGSRFPAAHVCKVFN